MTILQKLVKFRSVFNYCTLKNTPAKNKPKEQKSSSQDQTTASEEFWKRGEDDVKRLKTILEHMKVEEEKKVKKDITK